jgi:hypothetical protein
MVASSFPVVTVPATPVLRTPGWRKAAILIILSLITACTTTPVQQDGLHDSSLQQILAVYRQAVSEVDLDSQHVWHSGWVGNIWVNLGDDSNMGLCYHWQQLTYDAIATTVQSVQWDATGIAINYDTLNEHNAVLVYDPQKIARDELLSNPALEGAYVLDPWPTGKADVYILSDWLAMPLLQRKPAELREPYGSQAASPAQTRQ